MGRIPVIEEGQFGRALCMEGQPWVACCPGPLRFARPQRVGPGRLLAISINGRCRRVSPVAARSGDGLLSEPIAAAGPGHRERVFLPLNRLCRSTGKPAELGATPQLAQGVCEGRMSTLKEPSGCQIVAEDRGAPVAPRHSAAPAGGSRDADRTMTVPPFVSAGAKRGRYNVRQRRLLAVDQVCCRRQMFAEPERSFAGNRRSSEARLENIRDCVAGRVAAPRQFRHSRYREACTARGRSAPRRARTYL